MSQKNETLVLALSLILTLGIIGAGAWWFANRFLGDGGGEITLPTSPTSTARRSSLQERFSVGTRSLVPGLTSPDRQAGIAAIAAGNYDEAVQRLEAALAANRNDPEALIYLNNARIANQAAHTIAIVAPVGSSLNPALELLRGVAQAQDQINRAGGMNGVPLRVMIANDDNDPAIAQQVAQELVDDPDVLGVIGHFGSDTTLAAAPVYDKGGLVAISPTSTSVELSGRSPYVFRTVPSDRFAATALARYMLQTLQQQNVAILFNSESNYSQSLKDEFTTAVYSDGGQVVAEYDLVASNFNPGRVVDQAIDQGADVLMLAANTGTLDAALQVVAVNQQRLGLLGGDSLYNPKVLQVGGAAAVDMAVAVPWHVLANPQAPFVQTSRQLWGGDVNWRTATAYDAAQALRAAIEQNPIRQGVQQALRSSGFSAEGATSPVRFLPSGDRNQAAQIVTVESGTRSGYGYDFVPVSP